MKSIIQLLIKYIQINNKSWSKNAKKTPRVQDVTRFPISLWQRPRQPALKMSHVSKRLWKKSKMVQSI